MSRLTDVFRSLGRADALALRAEAATLTGTEIIAREVAAPLYDPQRDYSNYPVGAPVADEGQVWQLLQPHNAAYYSGRPSTLRALWSITHTRDPARAKAWVQPYGTSGLYMQGECYKDDDGIVWRCLYNDTSYTAAEYPQAWEAVQSEVV